MAYPQNTTHWSKYTPAIHMGPVADCEICEKEKAEYELGEAEPPVPA